MAGLDQRGRRNLGVVLAALLLLVGINVAASASNDEERAAEQQPLSRVAVQDAQVIEVTAAVTELSKGDVVRYRLPDLTGTTGFVVELGGLPQGKYHATYDLLLHDSGGTGGVCAFVKNIGTPAFDGLSLYPASTETTASAPPSWRGRRAPTARSTSTASATAET